MKTPSNGNILRVTGHLCGHRWIPRRPMTRSFNVFFDLRLNKRLSKQWWGWWFKTPLRLLWRHCNAFSWMENILEHISIVIAVHKTSTIRTPFPFHHRYIIIDSLAQLILILSGKRKADGGALRKYESVMPQVLDLLDENWNDRLCRGM